MRVVVTADAETDLDDIFEFVATQSVISAFGLVEKLRDKALRVGHAPRAYVLRPQYGQDVRCAFFQSYAILFQIARGQVEVLHFVHGARDLKSLFESKS